MTIKTFVVAAVLSAVALGGCAQGDREKAYVLGATVTDGAIVAGKITGENVLTACMVDDVNYGVLASGRGTADMFSYVPADTAHGKLHVDGQKANPSCTPPPPSQ